MIKRITLLMIIFILSLPASALAAEAGNGKIEGEVLNITGGENPVPDHDITLRTYLDNAEVNSTTTNTDALGNFIFEGLSTESDYSYGVMLTFQGVDYYYSDWLIFAEAETSKLIVVTVYDSTTSDEAISVVAAHTVITIGEDNSLLVEEFFVFENEADLTYVGSEVINSEGDKETLKFLLPDEAVDIRPDAGLVEGWVQSSADGFVSTMPVEPGEKLIIYSYKVTYSSGAYTLSREMAYDTDSFTLLVQGEGTTVTGERLTVQEPVTLEDVWYNHLSVQDLASGEVLTIYISGLPADQNIVIWVIVVLVVMSFVSALIYMMRKKQPQPVSAEDSPSQKKQRLLTELAQLDDDFEAGKIVEKKYHTLREMMKLQLTELLKSPTEKSGTE